MSYKANYVNGAWKADCDVCGRTYKNYELQLRWDGLYCCSQDWETRQPQDFVRGVADMQAPLWTRPEGTDIFVDQDGVADFSATPLTGAAPLTVAFTDESTNSPVSWQWNFGDLGGSTEQNPTHIYTTAGVYTVFLEATTLGGSRVIQQNNYITVTR